MRRLEPEHYEMRERALGNARRPVSLRWVCVTCGSESGGKPQYLSGSGLIRLSCCENPRLHPAWATFAVHR